MLLSETSTEAFTTFVSDVEPRLRHALIPLLGVEMAAEAAAEALAYAWEHWDRVRGMDNSAGYLYRVARTRARRLRRLQRRDLILPPVAVDAMPDVEPGLPAALARLSEKQRTCVWLVHGLDWRQTEVAALLGVSPDTVRTHVSRGMDRLRQQLGGLS